MNSANLFHMMLRLLNSSVLLCALILHSQQRENKFLRWENVSVLAIDDGVLQAKK